MTKREIKRTAKKVVGGVIKYYGMSLQVAALPLTVWGGILEGVGNSIVVDSSKEKRR